MIKYPDQKTTEGRNVFHLQSSILGNGDGNFK